MDLDRHRVRHPADAELGPRDPADAGGLVRSAAEVELQALLARLRDLQQRLHAGRARSLLLVFQGLDASGKDGAIRHLCAGLNPLATAVTAFKRPTELERAHDFLWRVHPHAPAAGHVAIFNRSQYEDILVPAVERSLPPAVIDARHEHICRFEALLADAGTCVLKFFLHISKAEQRARLQERLDDPAKRWKFDAHDLDVRAAWDDYTAVHEQIFRRTSTPAAPWYIVPADRKWFRNYLLARIVVHALDDMDLRYPDPPPGLAGVRLG